jgi:thiol-disulfide isomerase/thioredoxin
MKSIHKFLLLLVVLLVLLKLTDSHRSEGFANPSTSVVICKADWCGHCKTAAPEFDKLLAASPITLKNGTKATVSILDADKDKAEVSKLGIKGYPTILIMNGGTKTEYPGPRTHDGVLEFLNDM